MDTNDTIAAIASPRGKGAIGIIRLSGEKAHSIADSCLSGSEEFYKCEPRQINLYRFIDPASKDQMDSLMAIRYDKPASYTGEHMVELFCHGGEYVAGCILGVLVRCGVRIAQPGEFSRRAFLNGKIDVLKAEAVNEIINSRTPMQLRSAVDMYSGETAKTIEKLKESLESIMVDIESRIEFPDEADIKTQDQKSLGEKIVELKKVISEELVCRERLQRAEKGVIVVILGSPNAGKSSLFNAMVGHERAIVHNSRGTTRDTISEDIVYEGTLITLVDTAGIGESECEVESIGIKRSWELADRAEIVIMVTSSEVDAVLADEEILLKKRAGKNVVVFINKEDLRMAVEKTKYFKERNIPCFSGSLISKQGRERVCRDGFEYIRKNVEPFVHGSLIINSRQERIIREVEKELSKIELEEGAFHEEEASHYLRAAMGHLTELTCIAPPEDVLNRIFARFCIGK